VRSGLPQVIRRLAPSPVVLPGEDLPIGAQNVSRGAALVAVARNTSFLPASTALTSSQGPRPRRQPSHSVGEQISTPVLDRLYPQRSVLIPKAEHERRLRLNLTAPSNSASAYTRMPVPEEKAAPPPKKKVRVTSPEKHPRELASNASDRIIPPPNKLCRGAIAAAALEELYKPGRTCAVCDEIIQNFGEEEMVLADAAMLTRDMRTLLSGADMDPPFPQALRQQYIVHPSVCSTPYTCSDCANSFLRLPMYCCRPAVSYQRIHFA
jgi:hypothetical protein